MLRRRRVFLSLAAALVCGFIYLSRQDHGGPPEIRKEVSSRSEPECSHLKSLIINSNSTMTKFESKKFFQIVKSLQHCPWVQNQTELSLIQSQLKRCCNAPYKMIVTQENTPKGSQIAFDASKKTLKVTKNLFNLFPKTSPFMKPLRSCAVVGNGGILNGSFCGAQINRNDFVFRLNLPPLSLKDDVGTKTSLVTANPSIIIKRKMVRVRSQYECPQLKSLILISNMTKFESKKFFQIVKALQACPWVQDQRELSLLRSELKSCCNAPYKMIVTQENSPIGHRISFDADKKKIKVTKNLYNLFPKTSPFKKPLRRCAVVGNGGILNGSFCGDQINRNDFVFRMNLPPLNWKDDVGTKTDLVTANPSIIIRKYGRLRERRKPFIDFLKAYNFSMVLVPAFSFSLNTDLSLRVLYAMEDFALTSRTVFFNPAYLRSLSAHWNRKGLRFRRMSSGLMLVSAAVEVCEEVTLYGFWPFSEDLNEVPIPHHYYDNVPPKPGAHAMPDEFYQYLLMHIRGILRLNILHC